MASETKSDLVEELGTRSTKAELVELLGSRLKKDEISKLLDDESDGTKEELLKKLESLRKDELVQAVESKLTKDEIEKAVEAVRDEDDEDEGSDSGQQRRQQQQQRNKQANEEQDDDDQQDEPQGRRQPQGGEPDEQDRGPQRRTEHVDDTDLDWSAELEWAPPPEPTPAPVRFAGAAPFMPGARVRVDLSGLPTLGIFLGKGASAAGTITGVNAQERVVRVFLDACFDGQKEIFLPPERITLDR